MEEGTGMRAYFANVLTIVQEVVLLWWSALWAASGSMS